MDSYDPEQAPDSNTCLSLSEDDRIYLALDSHKSITAGLLNQLLTLHASIHAVIENQLALNTEYILETLAALMKQGVNRHDAVHAIGTVILEDIQQIAQGEEKFASNQYQLASGKLIKDNSSLLLT